MFLFKNRIFWQIIFKMGRGVTAVLQYIHHGLGTSCISCYDITLLWYTRLLSVSLELEIWDNYKGGKRAEWRCSQRLLHILYIRIFVHSSSVDFTQLSVKLHLFFLYIQTGKGTSSWACAWTRFSPSIICQGSTLYSLLNNCHKEQH